MKRHILHRDISINNVLIFRTPPSFSPSGLKEKEGKEDTQVKGILIDFDYAMFMSQGDPEGVSLSGPAVRGFIFQFLDLLD